MSNADAVVRRSKEKTEIFNNLSKEDVEKYQEAFSVSSSGWKQVQYSIDPPIVCCFLRRSGIKIPVVESVWQS